MKKKEGRIPMERALARSYTKEGYGERLFAFMHKRLVPERRQRPHWQNLPPLTA